MRKLLEGFVYSGAICTGNILTILDIYKVKNISQTQKNTINKHKGS